MENEIDIRLLLSILKRRMRLVAVTCGGFLAAAALYLLFATPQYTASASLYLDKSVSVTAAEVSATSQAGADFEKAAIESEVAIIQSARLSDAALSLLQEKGYFKNLGQKPAERQARAEGMMSRLQVTRIGETYILSIAYTAKTPQEAADAANAYAEAYIAEQLGALSQISSRTVSWLHAQTEELNLQATEAKKKAAEYRTHYNETQRSRLDRQVTPETEAATGTAAADEPDLNVLRNLDQQAETYNTLYGSYIEKLKTINMQESFPLTKTRIISAAVPPLGKSHPKSTLILGAALIFGAGLGLLGALLADSFDRTLRRAGQVRRELGVPFLGFLPARGWENRKKIQLLSADGRRHEAEIQAESVDSPFSLYAEVTRTLVNAIDHHTGARKKKIVGVISDGGGGDKSAVALNLAAYAAQSVPTLLIDADVRTPAFSTAGKSGIANLGDALRGDLPAAKACLRQEEAPHFAVLPSFGADIPRTLPYMTAARARDLVGECLKQYDCIVINFPPLLSPADVYGFAEVTDCFIVVGEWGKTVSNALNFHLKQNGIPHEKIAGAVLDNADMQKLEKHYGHKVRA